MDTNKEKTAARKKDSAENAMLKFMEELLKDNTKIMEQNDKILELLSAKKQESPNRFVRC